MGCNMLPIPVVLGREKDRSIPTGKGWEEERRPVGLNAALPFPTVAVVSKGDPANPPPRLVGGIVVRPVLAKGGLTIPPVVCAGRGPREEKLWPGEFNACIPPDNPMLGEL